MNNITNLIFNSYEDSGDAAAGGVAIGMILLSILIWGTVIALFITGVYFALKTEDTEVSKGRFFLHLLIFGFVVAALVYLLKVNGNKLDKIAAGGIISKSTPTEKIEEPKKETSKTNNSTTTKEQKQAKIDKLLKDKHITKAEHEELIKKMNK